MTQAQLYMSVTWLLDAYGLKAPAYAKRQAAAARRLSNAREARYWSAMADIAVNQLARLPFCPAIIPGTPANDAPCTVVPFTAA